MADNEHPSQGDRSKIIDMKLPLPWVLGIAGSVVLSFVYMAFSVDRMREDMTEVKTTLKVWNERLSTTAGEVALLRFRVETLEADKRAMGGVK